jgi:Aerotolerance regulator N-terminal
MLGLPLAFTIPWVLAALATLPVLYWLLRMTPPPPQRAVLPTLAIMRDLEKKEETPAHTPWWLLLLRILLAALVILAMAGPLWNPDRDTNAGRGPLLVVMDNSWSAAPDWKLRSERAQALIETAGASGRPVAFRATSDEPTEITPVTSRRALELLRGLQPQPHTLDRARHAASVEAFAAANAQAEIAWITDRVSVAGDAAVISGLGEKLGVRLTVYGAERPLAFGLAGPSNTPDALLLRVLRADAGASEPGKRRRASRPRWKSAMTSRASTWSSKPPPERCCCWTAAPSADAWE